MTSPNPPTPDPAASGPANPDPAGSGPTGSGVSAAAGGGRAGPYGIRFRPHGAIAVAGLVAMLGGLPLVSTALYLAPVLLIPLAVIAWALRSGTLADHTGLRVRALFGQRYVPWTEVEELAVERRDRVVAVLTGHRSVWLTAVRPKDIPALIAVAGQPLADS